MIKPSYPWPTPPPTPNSTGFRTEPYLCHNCGSEEKTLGVGSWLADSSEKYDRNRLVLCKQCYQNLNNQMLGRDYIQSIWTRLKILFTGKIG